MYLSARKDITEVKPGDLESYPLESNLPFTLNMTEITKDMVLKLIAPHRPDNKILLVIDYLDHEDTFLAIYQHDCKYFLVKGY